MNFHYEQNSFVEGYVLEIFLADLNVSLMASFFNPIELYGLCRFTELLSVQLHSSSLFYQVLYQTQHPSLCLELSTADWEWLFRRC